MLWLGNGRAHVQPKPYKYPTAEVASMLRSQRRLYPKKYVDRMKMYMAGTMQPTAIKIASLMHKPTLPLHNPTFIDQTALQSCW